MAKQVKAPYNFVSFPNTVLQRYKRLEQVPQQNIWDSDLCSGEITVTLTAETPVFVSDGNGRHPDFFRGADGKYQIPGSTLRGLIRENMQILGLGLVRPGVDLQDVTLYYRAIADAKTSLRQPLKDRYRAALGIETLENGKDSAPSQVQAGYLHHIKASGSKDTGYYIQPVDGELQRIPHQFRRWDHVSGKYVYIDNPAVADWASRGRPFYDRVFYWYENGEPKFSKEKPYGKAAKEGCLLRPGEMKKQKHFYLFPQENPDVKKRVPIGQEDLLFYQEDYETRKNSLGGTRREDSDEEKKRKKRFWALPALGECKPVFYSINSNGTVSFSPSSYYLRITYDYPLRQGLPEKHLTHSADKALFLDYPDSLLGFTGTYLTEDKNGRKKNRSLSLRSRVSVGDLSINEGATPAEQAITLTPGEPKLSFFPAYVQGGKDYNQSDFQFRGYKQYWLHEPQPQSVGTNTRVQSGIRPLPKGTSFTGTIRYQNLHEDELGLLLWCLRLEEGCYQPIGMGKPYGYGRMKLAIDELREFKPETLYGYDSILPQQEFFDPKEPTEARVSSLIDAYLSCDCVKNEGIQDLREMPHIKEFFAIRSVIAINGPLVSYMHIGRFKGDENEYQNVTHPLGTIQELQAEMKKPAASPSSDSDRRQTSCKWQVGDRVEGTVVDFTDKRLFVKVPGAKNQSVYFRKVPGGAYGNLESLVGYGRRVTIRLERIDPAYGPQWVIDTL